ncbi:hypothetical protein POPTR_007G092450v4 [Populus trichocarpa]|uniref:Uncharacterized protein n=1 Tax=Populus trichocarpa TaxID=3694 RepID=A0ACC0SQC9_POPTR|nr:hypothetical protein POPTR_007G092450v4 [Populus trichocarpa]
MNCSILDLCNNSLNNRTHFLFRKKHGPLGPSSSKASFPYSALPHQFSPDDFRTITHTKFWKNQVHPSTFQHLQAANVDRQHNSEEA